MLCCSQRIYEICTRNSIPVFEAAGREGFQAVECDIHETAKDKKGKRRFVIMHDQTLNRMCGLSGKNIYQKKLTYQKIQSKYRIKTGNNIESYTKTIKDAIS